jgi:hypothetical protein
VEQAVCYGVNLAFSGFLGCCGFSRNGPGQVLWGKPGIGFTLICRWFVEHTSCCGVNLAFSGFFGCCGFSRNGPGQVLWGKPGMDSR